MPPKRKCTEATLDESLQSNKRQLRSTSRRSAQPISISSPTKADTTASRRAQLNKASKTVPPTRTPVGTRRRHEISIETSQPVPIVMPQNAVAGNSSPSEPSVQDISNLDVAAAPQTRRGRPPKRAKVMQPPDTQPLVADSTTQDRRNTRSKRQRAVEVEVVIATAPKCPSLSRLPSPQPPEREQLSPDATSECPRSNDVVVAPPKESTGFRDHIELLVMEQKKAVMVSLKNPTFEYTTPVDEPSVNDVALQQLQDLIKGSTERAEGNSCLLLGPRGSGKSSLIEKCVRNLDSNPIVLRLSGYIQNTDRHALREIAFQLLQQTGSSLLPESDSTESNQEDENPFLDTFDNTNGNTSAGSLSLSLPPSSHLHSLVPLLLTLKRPVIVILDAFDLFALHPRQSLLYCLLDTVQNCRATSENRGIAVIGITSRVDTIQLLEKRVKSRFSGRTIRTAPPHKQTDYLSFVRYRISVQLDNKTGEKHVDEWNEKWAASVEDFLGDSDVLTLFKETFSISRDVTVLSRILANTAIQLSATQPYLSHKLLLTSVECQRSRYAEHRLASLPYPSLCLLVASIHVNTSGHIYFTFEMLYEIFRDEMRASASAPVQLNGGSIGLQRCTREVMMNAFESLSCAKLFTQMTAPSSTTAQEFDKYRSALDRNVVKKIVDRSNQTLLKKWFHKAQ